MRNKCKNILCALAVISSLATVAFAAGCSDRDSLKQPLTDIAGEVTSNGGFVVEKGNYVYFINGAESNTADNTYGDVVKGALMRISKNNLSTGNYSAAETVVPALFVAQNFDAGIYIYGDRVYYASPTTEKDQDGNVQNDWLSFKSAKLDGTDVMKDYYFRSESNSVNYRYVEVDGVVYCLHVDEKALYSYNTETNTDTLLVKGAESDFFFDTTNAEGATVYYTMTVTQNVDTAHSSSVGYTQVYSVRADAKAADAGTKDGKAGYTVPSGKRYEFDAAYLSESEEFKAEDYTTYPYVNLGRLVLDGRGSSEAFTDNRYSSDAENAGLGAIAPSGYKYTLQAQRNGGLYYQRAGVQDTGSDGEGSKLYYLSAGELEKNWLPIKSQSEAGRIDTVALNTEKASASAVFTIDGTGKHTYYYVEESKIYRATADADGRVEGGEPTLLVPNAGSATLWMAEGKYLYYYTAASNGNNIYRVALDGTEDDYKSFLQEENSEYAPAKILDLDWNSSWYKPEMTSGNVLLFSNAQSFGSKTYNYIYAVNLNGANGLMNAKELGAFNKKYEDVQEYITDLENAKVENVLKYYFRTGDATLKPFYDTIQDGVDKGYTKNKLYSEADVNEIEAFVGHKKSENKTANDYTEKFKDGDKFYDVESYYYNLLGEMKESDIEEIENAWADSMEKVEDTNKESGLKTWQIVLIAVGGSVGGLVVIAAIAIPVGVHVHKKRKAAADAEATKIRKPKIDTTDDKSIDVYATDDAENEQKE